MFSNILCYVPAITLLILLSLTPTSKNEKENFDKINYKVIPLGTAIERDIVHNQYLGPMDWNQINVTATALRDQTGYSIKLYYQNILNHNNPSKIKLHLEYVLNFYDANNYRKALVNHQAIDHIKYYLVLDLNPENFGYSRVWWIVLAKDIQKF